MANRIYDAFDSIKAQSRLVESTELFLSETYKSRRSPVRSRMFQKTLLAACMAFVIIAGAGGYSWLQASVSYVSIDVNPSIELALNRFDRVVSMTAYNAQGAEILKGLPLKGKKYTDAIDLIMASKAMDAYLTDESEIVFTVAADDSRRNELESGVARCSNHIAYSSESISADIAVVSHAHDNGLSIGKYYAYLQLAQYDDTVTVDECRNMSMSEIHGLVIEHEQDGEHGQEYIQDNNNDSSTDDSSTDNSSVIPYPHQDGHHQEEGHE